MDALAKSLLDEVLANKNNDYKDNYDKWMRYEPEFLEQEQPATYLQSKLPITPFIAKSFGVKHKLIDLLFPKAFYKKIIKQFNDISFLYNLLSDQASKNLLVKILAYRILGYKKVKLPRNSQKYWDDIENIRKLDAGKDQIKLNFLDLELISLDLSSLGYNIKLNATPEGVACTYVQHQYEYQGNGFTLKAEAGDVVLDCGACWGDTTLYFGHEVGPQGKVFAFEFLPENLKVLYSNLAKNPEIANSIQIIEHPVWDVSDKVLSFSDNGPGTHVSETTKSDNKQSCITVSIDDLVARNNIQKVDFIKMDIEGAELPALRGAANTIRKFKPKLAISAYHKADDLMVLPRFLHELNADYKFYLEHHTIHKWETVLYAMPVDKTA